MSTNDCINTDVVIVGAGPAGTVCAYLLNRSGINCALVDYASFPRDKVCGGGLTPKAYNLLAEIMPDLKYEFRAIKDIKLSLDHKPLNEIVLPEEIRIVCRKNFDYALLNQYLDRGGMFIQDGFNSFERKEKNSILVKLKSGKQIKCRYLVGADGANSQVRKQILGRYDGNVFFMEQYVDRSNNVIEGGVSKDYENGYYYIFPSVNCDIVGLGAKGMTVQRFRDALTKMGFKETKIKGAYIPVEEVDSGMDDVILIGDAGGFPNKLSAEGLYYAIATGQNAAKAIINGISFNVTNRNIFKRKRKERLIAIIFYSRTGLFLIRHFSSYTRLVRKIFVAGLSS